MIDRVNCSHDVYSSLIFLHFFERQQKEDMEILWGLFVTLYIALCIQAR